VTEPAVPVILTQSSGDAMLMRVIEDRQFDAESSSWMADALVRWYRDGGDAAALLRYARISPTAVKRRQAVRDYKLCEVAAILGGNTLAEQSHRLDAACRRFERAAWRRVGDPPPGETDRLLLAAHKAAPFPEFRQLRNIVGVAFWSGCFLAGAAKCLHDK
jgi:hypothetical protein